MKKILFSLCLLLAATSHAQTRYAYSPFRFDLGGGISMPVSGFGIGALIAAEPKYQIDNVALGVRFEWHLENQKKQNFSATRYNKSIFITGDYYFNTHDKFRPFAGIGLGTSALHANGWYIYYSQENNESYTYTIDSDEFMSNNRLGGMLRLGVDMPHLRVALQGNILGYMKYSYEDRTLNVDFNYISLIVAFGLGGNRTALP
jgi:opacity protein-like surface antigen